MVQQDAFDDIHFLNIFNRVFVGFFPLQVSATTSFFNGSHSNYIWFKAVYRFTDTYLGEGPKAMCRVMLSTMKMCRKYMLHRSSSAQ